MTTTFSAVEITNGELLDRLLRKLAGTISEEIDGPEFVRRLEAATPVQRLAYVCEVVKPQGAARYVDSVAAAHGAVLPASTRARVVRIVDAIIEICS